MKHLFVNVFAGLIILIHNSGKTAKGKRTLLLCSPIQSTEFRGPTTIPGRPGETKQ